MLSFGMNLRKGYEETENDLNQVYSLFVPERKETEIATKQSYPISVNFDSHP